MLCTQSPEDETSAVSGVLEQENAGLLKRLGALQQDKWTMEEKVTMETPPKWGKSYSQPEKHKHNTFRLFLINELGV